MNERSVKSSNAYLMEVKVREKDFVKKNITTQSLVSLFSPAFWQEAFLYLIFFFTKSCGTFNEIFAEILYSDWLSHIEQIFFE